MFPSAKLSLRSAIIVTAAMAAGAAAADTLPASGTVVRDTVIAMSLADAALPAGQAAAPAREAYAALKPETSRAMAQMAPGRRVRTASFDRFADRPMRYYRDPFFLVVGVAY